MFADAPPGAIAIMFLCFLIPGIVAVGHGVCCLWEAARDRREGESLAWVMDFVGWGYIGAGGISIWLGGRPFGWW